MNNINVSKKTNFIGWITQWDSLVIFSIFMVLIIITIILTGIFHSGPIIRDNLLFNTISAIILAILFIWIILKFMDTNINILGKSFDIGMIVYIFIVAFVIFVLGN